MFLDYKEISLRIFVSVFLSLLIGFEREIRHKAADIRTHILVGVGSCLIVLTSIYIFQIYKDVTIVDPTRMVAGIITGIGFLCAGTIIRAGESVQGLTTAATLWICSCIGISVGAGHYSAAVIGTLTVICVLIGLRSIERKIGEKFNS